MFKLVINKKWHPRPLVTKKLFLLIPNTSYKLILILLYPHTHTNTSIGAYKLRMCGLSDTLAV